MPDERERSGDETDERDGGGDPGPKKVLEDAPGHIEDAADAAADASEELKKEVRTKVDDAKPSG